MAESVTLEKCECSPNQNANMVESDSCETQEESPRSLPDQTPNSPVAAVKEGKNPELVRAIVNGDLSGFENILKQDIESNDWGSLRGFTCGKNTALHVVAGVTTKSSSTDTLLLFMQSYPRSGYPKLGFIVLVLLYLISLLTGGLLKTFSIQKHMGSIRNAQCMRKQKTHGLIEIAKIIYHQDPDLLNARNTAQETPLHCAAKAGNRKMVSLLIKFAREEDCKNGLKKLEQMLWARNEVGETALHEAARCGNSGVVKELLGADLDETVACLEDDNGISPLYLAVAAGNIKVVRQLIAAKHPPSYAGPDGQTALHAAVLTRQENIMREILEWKPDIAAKPDTAKNTPLHYATSIGNTYAVKQLLLKDTQSVYEANESGSFPVHLAAEAGYVKVIKALLRTCPDVGELLDREKRNFLHIAVEKKNIRVIMVAHKEGINTNVINAKDKDGNTPLHLAVINSESEIFVFLCQNKRVNPNIRNEVGLTPLDLSASLKDHQFTFTLNPQSIIHAALKTRGAFQNPCQPDLSSKVNDIKARADSLNRREGREMRNGSGVVVDIDKESTKYENMSKSLITGAVLIASATFASIFTVSNIYRNNDNTPHTLTRRNFFKAFIIVNMAAFICAIVSTIWLLYSALSNFHLKYRMFYFKWCTSLLHVAINFFILTFGLGAYIVIEPLSEWPAPIILVVSGIAILWNIIWSPPIVPLIFLVPYMSTEFQ
ncbi:protein ACCELERATED CELL DEATH 6-like [Carex rostrata]